MNPLLRPVQRAVAAVALGAACASALVAGPKTSDVERSLSFDYSATIKDIPSGSHHLEIWIPLPQENQYQKIRDLKIEAPAKYSVEKGANGNSFLHMVVDNPTAPALKVSMHFDAVRDEYRRIGADGAVKAFGPKHDRDAKRWLAPDRLVPLDAKVRGWAREVVAQAGAKTDMEKARAIYNHIVATVKYDKTGTGWGRGDIYYACDARRGNCTDFHAIFIGYCRAVGIPARFTIGFSLPIERGAGTIAGYHCWAECYVDGVGWVPVDASEAAKNPDKREYFFGTIDENRVEFTKGRDLVLNPRQHGEPLNYFVYPYAELDGKPYTSVDKQFGYKDISSPR